MIQFKPSKWLACLFLFLLPIMLGICFAYPLYGGSQGYGWCPTCGRDMPDSHFPHGGGGGGGGGGYGGYTPGPSPQEQQASAANREGLSYEKSGDWDNAIKSYREALRLNPNERVFLLNLQDGINNKGVALHKNGDYESALRLFEEALRLNPDYPNGRRNIRVAKGHIINREGLEYFNNEDYDSAISYFEESIRVNPEDQTARGNLAEARKRKREQAESIQLEDQWRKDEQRRKEEEERIAREIEEQKREEGERIAREIEEQKRKEEERIAKEVLEQKRKEEERIAKAMAEQKLKEATQRVNNMLDGLAKKLGASTGTSKSSNSSGLRLMRPVGARLFEKGTKDSAPVDLRLMPLNKPLVGYPPLSEGEQLQTQSTGKQTAEDSKGEISNLKIDVLLEALGPGKTWDESISYLEDKLAHEQDIKKKQAICDAIADTKKAADTDNTQQYLDEVFKQLYREELFRETVEGRLKGEISNPKVDVLLEALGPGKTWDDSISYLEDKLAQEQDVKKKQAIRDAIADTMKAADTDNTQQYLDEVFKQLYREELIRETYEKRLKKAADTGNTQQYLDEFFKQIYREELIRETYEKRLRNAAATDNMQ